MCFDLQFLFWGQFTHVPAEVSVSLCIFLNFPASVTANEDKSLVSSYCLYYKYICMFHNGLFVSFFCISPEESGRERRHLSGKKDSLIHNRTKFHDVHKSDIF